MQCPVCSVELVMSERQGIEIDYCPKCRGVWLDRGELDKIIEKSSMQTGPHAQPPSHGANSGGYYVHDDRKHYGNKHYDHKGHKRKSFFEELFD